MNIMHNYSTNNWLVSKRYSTFGNTKYATRFLLRPISHRIVTLSLLWDSFIIYTNIVHVRYRKKKLYKRWEERGKQSQIFLAEDPKVHAVGGKKESKVANGRMYNSKEKTNITLS